MAVRFCPRCGSLSFEKLRSHVYCISCNYSPDLDDHQEKSVPLWVFDKVPFLKPHLNDFQFKPQTVRRRSVTCTRQKLPRLFDQWVSSLSCREILSNPALLRAIEDLEIDLKGKRQ